MVNGTVGNGRLQGKVALVTGASRGIGRAIAERFLGEGAAVLGVSRSEPDLEVSGASARMRADVSRDDEVQAAVRTAVSIFGRLDVVVNNAAVEHEGTVEQTSLDDWSEVMDVNVRGAFLMSKHALPHLRETRGSIVNISSIDGLWAEPGLAAYCASKGAVLALTRAIAIDHGPEGVRCNSICPSYVATEMLEQFYDAQADPQRARAQASGMHPLRRISGPDDIAGVAAFLASDDASFVTGQSIVVDGGLTAGRTFDLAALSVGS
jgi:NAD(P)-dependent dehydrogenase (short-subunit alcohol dehydrogenase family)